MTYWLLHYLSVLSLAALPMLLAWPVLRRFDVDTPTIFLMATALSFAALLGADASDTFVANFAIEIMTPLSFGTIAFVALAAYSRVYQQCDLLRKEGLFFAAIYLFIGTPLFLSITGYLPAIDLYAAGYAGPYPFAILGAILAIGFVWRSWLCVIWVGLAAGAWLLGLHPSRNLWDYVVDPVGWTIAIATLPILIFRSTARRRSGDST